MSQIKMKGPAQLGMGDAGELIKELPPQSIHAIVTDPPY